MTIRHIKISGPFTDQEVGEFIALLRRIDEANPAGLFTVTIANPDGTMDEGEALLRAALPPISERWTKFARAAYRDDSFPPRTCDNPACGKMYRGPAVYCSLECALADA